MEVPEYELPEDAIAQHPAEPRDSSRLLDATNPSGRLVHRTFRDLPDLLGPGDVLVINTTRVMPARLRLYKQTGGAAEVLLLEPAGGERDWMALVRPGRRLQPGTTLHADPSGVPLLRVGEAVVPGDSSDGRRKVHFIEDPGKVFDECGTVALPPYIHEPLADASRYQTVYAETPGSVAAPTAGLHLTSELLERCRSHGVEVHAVDLAVGLATFKPIAVDDAEQHRMHTERYRVPDETMRSCTQARRVVAVGTTVVRALETAAATGEFEGGSNLYIRGDYPFAMVDVLVTNFHMPRSSLLVLLESFCGTRWRDIYSEALANGYRFLSFGDAMIVGRERR
ncbi:MAG TPA: tRNA preQ1(34) S-adenosylmethionine ribosyltransferase-isomerase QueA [Acidimicrobiales bacterium]|nr:tRNA preQ1(34) S-adenosylmethionine ribosyltransferase-isomerase QueA [Acidimicrobiales bacterium]